MIVIVSWETAYMYGDLEWAGAYWIEGNDMEHKHEIWEQIDAMERGYV